MDAPKKIKSSIAARVSLWVIVLSGLIFLAAAILTFHYSSQTIERIASENEIGRAHV